MKQAPNRNIPMHIDSNKSCIRVYGKTFPYLRFSSDHTPSEIQKSRDDAEEAAQAHGVAILEALATRLNTTVDKLTPRQVVFGRHVDELPKMEGSLRVPHDPDLNIWDARVRDLEREVCHSDGDRKKNAIRLEQAKKSQAAWQANHDHAVVQAAHDSDKDIVRARQHAADHLEKLRLDPNSTVEQIAKHEARKAQIDSLDGKSGHYWASLGALAPPDALPKAPTMLAEHVE